MTIGQTSKSGDMIVTDIRASGRIEIMRISDGKKWVLGEKKVAAWFAS